MQFFFSPAPLDNYSQWAFFEKAFSIEECEKIKSLFVYPESAATGGTENPTRNSAIRKSSVVWLPYSQDTKWIYEKLSTYVMGCNNSRYKMDLAGFGEQLQLGLYEVGDHYQWHQDIGPGNMTTRKLSVVLQLSNTEDYEGGELQFLGFDEKVNNGQGDLILFPSYNSHRVTEITKGKRYSLVAWISGPAFR